MDNAAAVFGCDVIAQNGYECALVVEVCEVIEQRIIAQSLELASLVGIENLICALILVVGTESGLTQNVLVSTLLVQNLHVVDFRTESQSQIGWQCPRSCSPGKEIDRFAFGADLACPANLEADCDCRIGYILVAAEVHFHV